MLKKLQKNPLSYLLHRTRLIKNTLFVIICVQQCAEFSMNSKYKKNKVVSDEWSLNRHMFMKKNNDARTKAIGRFGDIDYYLDYSDN